MQMLLIRHGLPLRRINADGSPADPPLSDVGHEQARLLADWLAHEGIDRIYSSPLRRARQTAEPLAERTGLEIEIQDRIREFDADSEQYIPMEELKRTDPERWKAFVTGGYASQVDFAAFVDSVAACLQDLADGNAGRRIAVFCHGGVINAWATHVLGIPPRLFFDATYTSVNRFLSASTGERSIESLNEVAHLRALAAFADSRAPRKEASK